MVTKHRLKSVFLWSVGFLLVVQIRHEISEAFSTPLTGFAMCPWAGLISWKSSEDPKVELKRLLSYWRWYIFVSSSPQGICRVFAGTCSCSFRRLKLKSARKHQQCFALGAHRKIWSRKVDSDKLTAKWTLIFCRLMITNYLTSSGPHPDILFWHSWKEFYLTVYLAYVLSRSWGPAVRSAHRDLAAVEVRQLGPLRSGARSWRRGGEGRGRQRQEASSTDKI